VPVPVTVDHQDRGVPVTASAPSPPGCPPRWHPYVIEEVAGRGLWMELATDRADTTEVLEPLRGLPGPSIQARDETVPGLVRQLLRNWLG
jgi:hypothetical protein